MNRQRCMSENLLESCDNDLPSIYLEDYVRVNAIPGFATVYRAPTNDPPSRRAIRGAAKPPAGRWQEVYIHSVERVTHALAEEVHFGRWMRGKNRRFLIPLGYSGWFEVVSQDGRSTRPIASVLELSRLEPNTPCLVRETIEGLDGAFQKLVVRKGQLLRPQETVRSFKHSDLLRCVDQRGDNVYLALEAKGLFSLIAGRSSIAGAHDVRSLVEKFRLPVTVRLLHGNVFFPEDSGRQSAIFKLLGVESEEVVNVLPLDATNRNDCWEMVPIPTRQRGVTVRPVTHEWISTNDELFSFLRRRCQCLVATQADTIRPEAIHSGHWLVESGFRDPSSPTRITKMNPDVENDQAELAPCYSQTPEEAQLFREIEDLYAAVRSPRRPPPPHHPQCDTASRLPNRFDTTAAFLNKSRGFTRSPFPSKRPAFQATNWKLQQRQYSSDDTCLPKRRNLLSHLQAIGNKSYHKTMNPNAVAAPVGWAVSSSSQPVPAMRLTARVKPMLMMVDGGGMRRLAQEHHRYERKPVSATGVRGRTSPLARAPLVPGALREFSDRDQILGTKETERLGVRSATSSSVQMIGSCNTLIPKMPPQTELPRRYDGGSATDLDTNRECHYRSLRPAAVPIITSRPVLLRPTSYAGTSRADDPLHVELHGRLPPPLPPKRVASLSNLILSKDASPHQTPSQGDARFGYAFTTSSIERSFNQQRQIEVNITKQLPQTGEHGINQNPSQSAGEYSVNGKPTAKIIGTVSRTRARTLRRIRTRSTGTFDVSSSSLDEDDDDEKSPREVWRKTDSPLTLGGLPLGILS